MKQIIFAHVGQCGIQAGLSTWQLFCLQHGVSPVGFQDVSEEDDIQNCNVLFDEGQKGKLTPRAVYIDTEQTSISQIKYQKYNKLFHPDQMVAGKIGSSGSYARGHYTVGRDLVDRAVDKIRHQVQKTDFLQAIITTHSIIGGTGSGMQDLLSQHLGYDYSKKQRINLIVYPSQHHSNLVVEPYNAAMSCKSLIEQSSLIIPFSNEKMYQIMENNLQIQFPTYRNINYLIGLTASSITAGLRFQGENPWSIKDILVNLVPFPRITFSLSSFSRFSPFSSSNKGNFHHRAKQIFLPENSCIDISKNSPRYVSSFIMHRNRQPIHNNFVRCLKEIQNVKQNNIRFVKWYQNNMKIGKVDIGSYAQKVSGYERQSQITSMLSINTGTNFIFDRVGKKFDEMYSRRAFIQWYICEGQQQFQLSYARQNLEALKIDFRQANDEEERDDI